MCVIVRGAVNLCWGFFKWGLLVVLIAAIAAVPYFYDRLDSEIRTHLRAMIAEHYAGLDVSIRSAQFIEHEGIEIRDLVIVETEAAGPQAELLCLPEVFLHSQGTLQEMLSGAPKVREVVIRRPVLRMTRRHDTTWSCSRLLPFPKLGDGKSPLPTIRVENATVEVFDPTKNPSSMLVLRNVSLEFSEPDDALPPRGASQVRQIEGTFEGDYVSRVEVRGKVDLKTGNWSLGGVVDDLEITRESLHAVPQEWLAGCRLPDACRAHASFQYALAGGNEQGKATCRYSVTGNVSEGRVEDSRLPGPLTELKTSFAIDNRGFVLRDLEAHSGPTTLTVHSLQSWGLDSTARKSIDGEVHRLELDHNLLGALPDRFGATWSKYLPLGQINAKFTSDFDGTRWHPKTATVECLDVSFSYYKFPYRLYRARGTVRQGDDLVALKLENDVLQISMEAFSGKQRVTISGTVTQPLSGPYGDVTVRAAELELHDELYAAMKEEPRKVVESLRPTGRVGVYLRVWSDRPGVPPRKHMIVNVLGGSIRYRGFPYPLSVHRGQIEMVDDEWVFRDFTATNDTGVVHCGGQFGLMAGQKELLLKFNGSNIALEEELRDSLSHPNMRRLWNDLRLRGMIDLEDLKIRYQVEPKKLDVTFRAVPHPQVTSIEPVHIPYRLEKLRGVLDYRDGQITIEQFRADHGDARMGAKVTCRFTPDGSWSLRSDEMWVDQLQLDNELSRALPERLRSAVTQLNVETPINLQGYVEVSRNAAQIDRLMSNWDVKAVFHGAHLNCGVPVNDVSGDALLAGGFDGEKILCRGELRIDSLTYRDIQITQISGPILINDQQVLLGSSVEPVAGQRPRPLAGKVFGGDVYGDGWVALGPNAEFKLTGRLFEADLARTAQELVSGRQTLKGKVIARAEIWGRGNSVNAFGGRGNIQLHHADIYELPAMVSLLKILRREPDNSAFSESDIDFVIQGDHIYLPKIVFRGDVISLKGAGEMDFDHNVNLTFGTPRLGGGELGLSFFSDVLGGAGDQIIVIHVDGPASNPRIVRQPLPALNRMIEQLQKDLQIPVDSPGLFPQTGSLNSYGRTATQRR